MTDVPSITEARLMGDGDADRDSHFFVVWDHCSVSHAPGDDNCPSPCGQYSLDTVVICKKDRP